VSTDRADLIQKVFLANAPLHSFTYYTYSHDLERTYMTLKLLRRPPPINVFSSSSPLDVSCAGKHVRLGFRTTFARRRLACPPIICSVDNIHRHGGFLGNKRVFSNLSRKCLAHVRDERDIVNYFTRTQHASFPPAPGNDNHSPLSAGDSHGRQHPPDERTLKLGKTIQTLHTLLPHLLTTPLPQEILSPQITLHLFPSTHPHLPTVSGRIAYNAALWTAPVAWGRVPVVGNVKLIVLSERMIKNGTWAYNTHDNNDNNQNNSNDNTEGSRSEKLIVKWRTCGKSRPHSRFTLTPPLLPRNQVDKITEFLGSSGQKQDNTTNGAEFAGLFIFEFDTQGRIVKHVIEHVLEGRNWEGMPRVINVTDWLLGLARGRKEEEGVAGLAWSEGCGDVDSGRDRRVEHEEGGVK